ncbi:T7SS effector LXG polymorphic toxin [Enterococcus sp. BWR-S5]|uniref:T7SS effector LXG polymorphic toxin n=1 Tax=Enterococcus sp. BWR-S5 TaxID=2787714 RepID=UPI001923928C|nr:T7SS effector LXG polymorphic toxin [Enterococcus sp. BWR-S5]MBL1225300.1 hypothetical protein [Enterococcus sp. BWR-S5]
MGTDVDMYLGASQSQAGSADRACRSYQSGIESLQGSIKNFGADQSLKGDAYRSAKTYFQSVYEPLLQGLKLVAEATGESVKKLPEKYISEVDSCDLRSSELENEIEEWDQQIQRLNEQLQFVKSELPVSSERVQHIKLINSLINDYTEVKRKLEEKLEKLLSFNASSTTIFSELDALKSAVNQGLAQVSGGKGWNTATGQFSTDGLDMSWVSKINQANKESSTRKLEEIISPPFSTGKALDFYDLASENPDMEITPDILAWLQEYSGDIQGLFVDFSLSVLEEGLKQHGDDWAVSIGTLFGTVYNNAPYGSWTSGVNQSITAGVTSTAQTTFNSTTNALGSTASASGIGIGIGTLLGLATGDSFGQALASSAVTTGISLGITALFVSNPVGLAAVATATIISVGVSVIYNYNFLGIKDITEEVGGWIDTGLSSVGNALGNTWNSLWS